MRFVCRMTAAAALMGAAAAFMIGDAAGETFVAEHSSCRVVVEGTSTMHPWKAEGQMRGTLVVTGQELDAALRAGSAEVHPASAEVEVVVSSLKSGKRDMDKRMHAALKAEEHPLITYRVKSARPEQETAEGLFRVVTVGTLSVAGTEQEKEIPVLVKRMPEGGLELTGEIPLRMTDFGVKPPKLMAGMLKVGDEIRVRWQCLLVPAEEPQRTQ